MERKYFRLEWRVAQSEHYSGDSVSCYEVDDVTELMKHASVDWSECVLLCVINGTMVFQCWVSDCVEFCRYMFVC